MLLRHSKIHQRPDGTTASPLLPVRTVLSSGGSVGDDSAGISQVTGEEADQEGLAISTPRVDTDGNVTDSLVSQRKNVVHGSGESEDQLAALFADKDKWDLDYSWLFEPIDDPFGATFDDMLASAVNTSSIDTMGQTEADLRMTPLQQPGRHAVAHIPTDIPLERIWRVEKLWSARKWCEKSMLRKIRDHAVEDKSRNLFCISRHTDSRSEYVQAKVGQWGLEESCWINLHAALSQESSDPLANGVQHQIHSNGRSQFGTTDVQIPSLKTLDVVLGLYFGETNSITSPIHASTFSAASCPTPLLLAILALGFNRLNTTGARKFVSQSLPVSR